MRTVIFVILVLWLFGCSNSPDRKFSGLLSKEKMEAVMWDIIGADVFTEQFVKKDTSKKPLMVNMQLQNKIFAIHNVTKADYYKSYEYYMAHSEQMKIILDSITSKAERERSKMLEKQYGKKSQK
jgi:hypothetical protein